MSDNPFQVDVDEAEIDVFQTPAVPYRSPSPNELPPRPSSTPQASDKAARLQQLRQREEELKRRQTEINALSQDFIPSINFPPFFPVIHYDLEADIPQSAQKCVQNNLIGLSLFIVRVFTNLIAVLSVRGLSGYNHASNFVFAIIQGAAGIYCAMNFSFSSLYNCARKHDIQFSWTIYHCLLLAWIAYLLIGFPSSGSVGIATLLDLIAKGESLFGSIIGALNTLLIGACGYFYIYCLFGAQEYQRVSGVEEALMNQQQQNSSLP